MERAEQPPAPFLTSIWALPGQTHGDLGDAPSNALTKSQPGVKEPFQQECESQGMLSFPVCLSGLGDPCRNSHSQSAFLEGKIHAGIPRMPL